MEALFDKTKDDSGPAPRSIEFSRPNVDFIDDDFFSTMDIPFGAGTETYLRRGGQLLTYTHYYKGVSTGPEHYRGTEKLWTFDLAPLSIIRPTTFCLRLNRQRCVIRGGWGK